MIVIDSSALVAILRDEPERRSFIDAIVDHGEPRLSAATYVEASMVMELRLGDRGGREIDVLIEDVGMAMTLDAPVLFRGDDFALTDIKRAL